MNHLISLKEQNRDDIVKIVELAEKLKTERKAGRFEDPLKHKTLLMLFQKTSTRTRVSFEVAMSEMGGHAVFIDSRTSQFSMADFGDEVRALMRFGDVLLMRALKSSDVLKAASYNRVPVIDGCSEKYHPAQALGDILTMAEHSGGLQNVKKVVWLGIENNVSNTLKLACAKLGIDIFIVAPETDADSVDGELNKQADAMGKVHKTLDLKEALDGAQYIHTDTWTNMEFFSAEGGSASGGENAQVKPEFKEEYERRQKVFMPYQLNAALLAKYAPQAKIMHCMPCHEGYEISRDAIDHKNSIIFAQAENRLHIEKAILAWLLQK